MRRSAVRLHADPRREAVEAQLYYWRASTGIGDAFFLELEHAIDAIAEHPDMWPPFLAGTRRYLMRRFPYSVIYRRRARGIQVVAVAHAKRRPGYWLARLH